MERGTAGLFERTAVNRSLLPNLRWAQMDAGDFEVGYSVVDDSPLRISRRTVTAGFALHIEFPPQHRLIGFIGNVRRSARFFGSAIDEDHYVATRHGIELNTAGPSAIYGLLIDEPELLRRYSNSPDALCMIEQIRDVTIGHDRITSGRLRSFLDAIFATRAQMQRGGSIPPPEGTLSGTLVPLMAHAMSGIAASAVVPSRSVTRRLAAVRTCEEYMQDHLDERVTLLDLSHASGLESRTLINAFEAITDFSPMDYLKRLRLNRVRQVLLTADKATSVTHVAAEWGFWHMGHFSASYRAMFGETPSQTLTR